jgi:FtsH-binding integral membrane protein
MAAMPEYSQYGDATSKLAVFGALQLYLDFINIFLFLLRLFAGGRD